MVEHRQNAIVELSHVTVDLLRSRFWLQSKLLGQKHASDALGHRANALIEVRKELIALVLVGSHVHPVLVKGGLVPVANVHHLDHCRAVD